MGKGRRRYLVALLVAMTLIAAGCGDDDDGDDGDTGQETESKGTVKIGVIGTSISSTTRQPQPNEPEKVADAWARMVNADGGINGYQVEIVHKDGQGDVAKILQAVTELDQAGVVALAGQGVANQLTPSIAKINEAKLPVIGGSPYTPEFDTNPLFFQVSASYYAGVAGQVWSAKHAGADHFRNVYCTEVAACAQSVPVTEAAAKAAGMKHSAVGASAVAADYTATCLSAKDAGTTFFQSNGLRIAQVIVDCKRQNYHPIYGVGGAANQATVEAVGDEKYAGNLYEFGAFYDGPEVQRFRQAIERTDLQEGQWGQQAVQTWLGLEMVGATLERMDKENPTRADFLAVLLTVEDEDLDGQIPPVDYTVQKGSTHFLQDCWTEHTLEDGELVHMDEDGEPVDRLTFICGSKG